MKKVIPIFIAVIVIMSFSACSNLGKATVIFKDGRIEKTTAEKLIELYQNDREKFKNKYSEGTQLVITDEIKWFVDDYTLELESGIYVELSGVTYYDLGIDNWNKEGDTLEITAVFEKYQHHRILYVTGRDVTLII